MTLYKLRLEDERVLTVWRCEDCGGKAEVAVTFFQDNGTPICAECDRDMRYDHVYLHTGKLAGTDFAPAFLRQLGWREVAGKWTHPASPGVFDLETAIEVQRRAVAGYTANRDPNWEPSADDVRWLEGLIARLPDEPKEWLTSECTWRLHKERKSATLVRSIRPLPTTVKRTIRLLEQMGWKVFIPEALQGEADARRDPT